MDTNRSQEEEIMIWGRLGRKMIGFVFGEGIFPRQFYRLAAAGDLNIWTQ